MKKYNPSKIEKKWQKYWETKKIYRAREESKKPKYYQLETFPYPSAAGLHVGHPKGYIAEDIHARYMRMNSYEVLYTMGWDAFGLPTENYAIKVGKSPQEVAVANIKNFKRQVQMFGLSYDWDREINTSSPEYYKWTQWLFIQLFKKGLAYRAKAKVNWCPKDQTVLANEQVIDGKCERDGEQVIQKEMEQWFLKITDYAERLLSDLDGLNWPEATIKRQQDWIGRSEGSFIKFPLAQANVDYTQTNAEKSQRKSASSPREPATSIEVFTTRPDTLFGATYMVLAPEHSLVEELKGEITNWSEVRKYVEAAKRKTELQRKMNEKDPPSREATEGRGKTGVELKGIKAINPAMKEEIPVWIADYVLMSYGTGAIMAVPAHDERDFEFAKKFELKSVPVVLPVYVGSGTKNWMSQNKISDEGNILNIIRESVENRKSAYINRGSLVNSGQFNGMTSDEAMDKITQFVGGKKHVQYKLRDWSVSRQRYWGAPIPMIHCDSCGIVPVLEEDLLVKLPPLKNYRPTGMPPLASSEKFMKAKCPKCGNWARRDPETLDTFVDSSWYYLRYIDPNNRKAIFDKSKAAHWLPVDLYVIGAEHTTAHLLYARFIAKFLYDLGYLKFKEPFLKLRHQGMILGPDGRRMSKRWGNVINPDDVIKEYGADVARMYEMFMGPFEDGQPWDTKGIVGVYRFMTKFWEFTQKTIGSPNFKKAETTREEKVLIHKTIKKVGEDIKNLKFNTAVSAMMVLLNGLARGGERGEGMSVVPIGRPDFEMILKIVHPFAPHITQEVWSQLGNKSELDYESWPKYDPKLVVEKTIRLVVQVNGKTRDVIEVPAGLDEAAAREAAMGSEKVKKHVGGHEIKNTIYVPDRLINVVV